MKKFKCVKRIFSLFLATVMMLGVPFSAFAAETISSSQTDEYGIHENQDITPRLNNNLSAVVENVPSNGSARSQAYLDSYIGVTKKFTVRLLAYSGNLSGTISVYIKRVSDNQIVGSWGLNSNSTEQSTTFTLPKSGYYEMVVYNGTSATISLLGFWQ